MQRNHKLLIVIVLCIFFAFIVQYLLGIQADRAITNVLNQKSEISKIILYANEYTEEITQYSEIDKYSHLIFSGTLHKISGQEQFGDVSSQIDFYINNELLISIKIFNNPDYSILSGMPKYDMLSPVAVSENYYWFIPAEGLT